MKDLKKFGYYPCTRPGLAESSTAGGVSNFAYMMLHLSL